MRECKMDKDKIIEFHKRFANGEQYLYMTLSGDIEEESKSYYWQERAVFNHIKPIINSLKKEIGEQTEEYWYGKNGVVARLVPIQKAYNSIKNRRHEHLNRISVGVLMVEDGSIDLDNLEEEGIAPGKVIVYRQGSTPPTFVKQQSFTADFNEAEDRLAGEFQREYISLLLE